jgi:hypothetical protein
MPFEHESGYIERKKGRLYERNVILNGHCTDDGMPTTFDASYFISMKRYSIPSTIDVIDHIIGTASQILTETLPSKAGAKSIESILKELPDEILIRLMNKDSKLLQEVSENSGAADIEPWKTHREQYIFVRFGLLSRQTLDLNINILSDTNPDIYDTIMANRKIKKSGFGEYWTATVKLDDGDLPDHLGCLLSCGTTKSEILIVNKISPDFRYEQVSEVFKFMIDAVYEEIGVLGIEDSTDEVIALKVSKGTEKIRRRVKKATRKTLINLLGFKARQ